MSLQKYALGFVCLVGCFMMVGVGAVAQTAAPAATGGAVAAGQTAAAVSGNRVHGTIVDPDGELIPGATVSFTPAGTKNGGGAGKVVKSGSDGTYAITLAPGTYTYVVTMPGFAAYSALAVKIPAVASTTLDAKLTVGAETTVVNVESDALQLSVDADSNASSSIISGKDLDALSDDPDELQSELTALAGPSAGPNGGQIYVDGFTGGQLPPKSSIREIRVNQNPFSAQYDKLGYGRIEVFTKPGTDKIHGNLQINGNPSQFNSASSLVNNGVNQPPYHTIFVFGNLTGPINKFASYSLGGSYRDIEDDAFTNAFIYAPSSTSTTLCAQGQANCTQSSAQFSTHSPQSRFEITPRFDLALGSKNVLTTRFQVEQNTLKQQGIGNLALPQAAYNSDNNDAEVQMSDTQTFSSRLINETRFEYERQRTSTTAQSNAPTVNVSGAFTSGGAGGQSSSDHQDHFEVQNYTSLALKKNFIRFGGRLRTTREAQNTSAGTNGLFTYTALQYTGTGVDNSYATGTASQFNFTKINTPTVSLTFADLGVYLEDDWKIRPNLSVSYGFRYETQNHLSDHHDIAPRVSISYGLGNGKSAPKTVLRGGFGMFYDRFGQGNILTLLKENGTNESVYLLRNPSSACNPNSASALANCEAQAQNSALTQTVYSAAGNLRTPYIVQFAAGADQTVGRIGTLSLNYLHSQGVHQLATQNIGYNFANPAASGSLYQYFSEGVFQQNQLILNARVQTGKRVSLFGYYQFGHVNGDTSGAGSFLSTPGNIAADYGRTGFDVRQRVFLGGSVTLPKFIQFSPFMIGQTGNPYNVTTGRDDNGDGLYNDRPQLVAASLANGTTIKTIAGCGTFAPQGTVTSSTGATYIAPINACTGPGLFTFNFRLTKTFGFGGAKNPTNDAQAGAQGGGPGGGGPPPGGGGNRGGGGGGRGGPQFGGGGASTGKKYNVALGLQVQNLFNNSDLGTPQSSLTAVKFGQSTQLAQGPYTTNSALRRISLQASFNF